MEPPHHTNKEHFLFVEKPRIVDQIITSAIEQHPELNRVSRTQLGQLAHECVEEIEFLHNSQKIMSDLPLNIDIIWIISAPGLLLTYGSKPGWSSQFPWLNNCEREVVGTGIDLAISVTAKRLGKTPESVTKEEMVAYSPWIIYNGPPHENADVATLLKQPEMKIPQEKVYLFDEVFDNDGTVRKIVNTADQARSIHMPPNVSPRIIAICVLAAQWVRLGRLLAATQTLPQDANILVVPIQSPKGYEFEHAIMECRGALINSFKNMNAPTHSIRYRTIESS